jgi:hypothetical protein
MNNFSSLTTTPTATSQYSLDHRASRLTTSPTRRTLERHETRPTQHASDVLDLPYDMLGDEADMTEYLEETVSGVIPKRTISKATGKPEDHELVTFKINDPENPKNWSKVYSMSCFPLLVTCLY